MTGASSILRMINLIYQLYYSPFKHLKIMKKYLFLLFAVCTTISSQAQLKVLSDGTAYLQRDSEVGNAILSVGSMPADSLHNYDLWRMGIRSYMFGSGLSNTIGVFGEASHQNIYQHLFTAGVWVAMPIRE